MTVTDADPFEVMDAVAFIAGQDVPGGALTTGCRCAVSGLGGEAVQ